MLQVLPPMAALSPLSVSSSQVATYSGHVRRDSEIGLPPFHKESVEDEAYWHEQEYREQTSDFDALFDQYICSPSPATSLDNQISNAGEMPLAYGIHDHHDGQSELLKNSGSFSSDGTIST